MRLLAGGDVGIQTPLLAGLNVVRAAVAFMALISLALRCSAAISASSWTFV